MTPTHTSYGPPSRAQSIAAGRLAAFLATLGRDEAPDDAGHAHHGIPAPVFAERERVREAARVAEIERNLQPDEIPTDHRRCRACKHVKPLGEFSHTALSKDGRAWTCDGCAGVPNLPWAEIAAAWAKGARVNTLARRYGVDRSWIWQAIRRTGATRSDSPAAEPRAVRVRKGRAPSSPEPDPRAVFEEFQAGALAEHLARKYHVGRMRVLEWIAPFVTKENRAERRKIVCARTAAQRAAARPPKPVCAEPPPPLPQSERRPNEPKVDTAEVARRWRAEGLTTIELAAEYGVASSTICRAVAKHTTQAERRARQVEGVRRANARLSRTLDPVVVAERWRREGLGVRELARIYKASNVTIGEAIAKHTSREERLERQKAGKAASVAA